MLLFICSIFVHKVDLFFNIVLLHFLYNRELSLVNNGLMFDWLNTFYISTIHDDVLLNLSTEYYLSKFNSYITKTVDLKFFFQDPISAIMEGLINFHHDLMSILVFIAVSITIFLGFVLYFHCKSNYLLLVNIVSPYTHNTNLEIGWTLMPTAIILGFITPSYALLYAFDIALGYDLTWIFTGCQWYWKYQTIDNLNINPIVFCSYVFNNIFDAGYSFDYSIDNTFNSKQFYNFLNIFFIYNEFCFNLIKFSNNLEFDIVLNNKNFFFISNNHHFFIHELITLPLLKQFYFTTLTNDFFSALNQYIPNWSIFLNDLNLFDYSLKITVPSYFGYFNTSFYNLVPNLYIAKFFTNFIDINFNNFTQLNLFELKNSNITVEFDSRLLNINDTYTLGMSRLLNVDNYLCLPTYLRTRCLFTADDVLHSYALPSAGLKVDCTPGRLNESNLQFLRSCIISGQCSEICGIHHAFMPTVVSAIDYHYYVNWLMYYIIQSDLL